MQLSSKFPNQIYWPVEKYYCNVSVYVKCSLHENNYDYASYF
jgi:hypothetical protein